MAGQRTVGSITVACGEGQRGSGDVTALSPIYRNVVSKDGWPSPAVTTLHEMFQASVKRYGIEPCLGRRPVVGGVAGPFVWSSYREVDSTANKVLGGLRSAGVGPEEKVGVYAPNSPEWMLVVLAANRGSNAIVPLYDSLGEDAVAYSTKHSGATIVFAVSSKLTPLIAAGPLIRPKVHSIVYWGDVDLAATEQLKQQGFSVYYWPDFLKIGEGNPALPTPPRPDTIATIMYTSGTTGNPKGVVLTHGNVLAAVISVQKYVEQAGLNPGPGDSLLSFLTLAHIFGRALEEAMLSIGGCIGYWQGDVRKLSDDILALRPTIFGSVPRVLERIESGIQAKLSKQPWPMQMLFKLALDSKLNVIRSGLRPIRNATPILDWLLFNRTRASFGGRVKIVVSGGAPLATHIEHFLQATLCCPVVQGYGLTETCAVSFIALPLPGNTGTVGPPVATVELRFEGNDELGYDPLGNPPRGEVCIRGPSVFTGYYQDPEKTAETFDKDGFFHTGDVGELTPAGTLKIIDRIKNMFKLAQGEYIAAEKLEQVYLGTPVVDQIWVHGESLESFLVAVVVPCRRTLTAWATAQGLPTDDFNQLVREPKAVDFVVAELAAKAKAAKLKGFERIPALLLEPEPFSVENDLMTPSFKLKRNGLKKKYREALLQLYEDQKARQISKAR